MGVSRNVSVVNSIGILATTRSLSSTSTSKFPKEEYEKNGFFVVRGLVDSAKLDKYARRFKKICEEKIKVPVMTVMKDVAITKSEFLDGEKAITKIQDFCFDDELFEFCTLPEIIDYVKSVTGPNVMAMHTMLINKPPGNFIISKFDRILRVFFFFKLKEFVF